MKIKSNPNVSYPFILIALENSFIVTHEPTSFEKKHWISSSKMNSYNQNDNFETFSRWKNWCFLKQFEFIAVFFEFNQSVDPKWLTITAFPVNLKRFNWYQLTELCSLTLCVQIKSWNFCSSINFWENKLTFNLLILKHLYMVWKMHEFFYSH